MRSPVGGWVSCPTDRLGQTLTAWLRAYAGVEVVCRDGSASYAQAIANALPDATHVSDRWHLWPGLGAAVDRTVIAHMASTDGFSAPTSAHLRAATGAETRLKVGSGRFRQVFDACCRVANPTPSHVTHVIWLEATLWSAEATFQMPTPPVKEIKCPALVVRP